MRAIIAGLLTSASLAAQSVAQVAERPVVRGALGTTLDQYLQRAALSGFSGVVLVAWHDTVVLHRAYGWLDARHLVPLTVATGFAISSNTKMFSGVLTAILASQGRLRLSDSIGRYLPDVPEDKRGITIHQLLTHSAGLADTYAAESSSTLDGVRRILATPLVHDIGEKWEYSNDGFHLLEAILEVAGRKPYVRLRGRAAAATIRIVWSDSTIAFVLAGTPRPYLPLLRRADGAFVGHDFFAGRSTTLSVSSRSAELRAQSIRVGKAGEQSVFVRRQ